MENPNFANDLREMLSKWKGLQARLRVQNPGLSDEELFALASRIMNKSLGLEKE